MVVTVTCQVAMLSIDQIKLDYPFYQADHDMGIQKASACKGAPPTLKNIHTHIAKYKWNKTVNLENDGLQRNGVP